MRAERQALRLMIEILHYLKRALNYGNYGIFRILGDESDKLDLRVLRVEGLEL